MTIPDSTSYQRPINSEDIWEHILKATTVPKYRDPEWLHQEHVEKGRTLTEIAEACDVHPSTVSRWRKKLDVKKSAQRQRLICPVCGSSFHRYQNRIERATHTNVCSRDCLYDARRDGLLDWTNTIHHGDARSMEVIPDDSIDLVVSSPPYNVGKDYGVHEDDLSVSDYREFLLEAFDECTRVLRNRGGRLFLVISGFGQGADHVPANKFAIDVAESVGLKLRRELIWQKSVSAGRSTVYGSYKSASSPAFFMNHESLLIFYQNEFRRPDDGDDSIDKGEFLAGTDSVWEIPSSSSTRVGHPAPFPEKLAGRAIELLSYRDDIVLDPFIGSGTTAVAAKKTDRRYVGFDITEDYCEIARERIDALS